MKHPSYYYADLVAALRSDADLMRRTRGVTVRFNYDDAADAIDELTALVVA